MSALLLVAAAILLAQADPATQESSAAQEPAGSAVEPPALDTTPPTLTREMFDCERLRPLWGGSAPKQVVDDAEPDARAHAEAPRSLEEAAVIYAEYFRYLFLSARTGATCEIRDDPLLTVANACAAVARGRGSVAELARIIASDPQTVRAVWLLDAVVRHDTANAVAWRTYFGPGPAFRIIDLMFDNLPAAGPPVYEALLRLTETADGVFANYIASRFIALFVNEPQWVLMNAERLLPFGPALRLIFCNYLTVSQREALALGYGAFPYSDAQVAVIELVGCL